MHLSLAHTHHIHIYSSYSKSETWRRRCAIWLKDDEKEPLLDVKNLMKTAWSYVNECLPSNKDPRLRTPGSYTFIVSSAFRGMNVLAGLGWLCIDSDHMVCEAISHPIRSSSSLDAELTALFAVSKVLNSYNEGAPIRILSDCELAVSILKGVTRPPPEFNDLVEKIMGNFTVVEVEVVHVCEKFTSAAHRLACLAAFTGYSQYWKDAFPDGLIDSVANSFD